MNNEMVKMAFGIAIDAHAGQRDKGGNPYIQHPLAVASKMDTESEIIVALLHDVVEDTDYTIDDLERDGFSEEVMDAIRTITHAPDEDYFVYIRRVKKNDLARKVKIADLWHNSQLDRLNHAPTESDIRRIDKYNKAREILNADDAGEV